MSNDCGDAILFKCYIENDQGFTPQEVDKLQNITDGEGQNILYNHFFLNQQEDGGLQEVHASFDNSKNQVDLTGIIHEVK